MDAALIAALQSPAPLLATLVRIDLPDDPVCLTDGGFVTFGGETYLGDHPTYGVLSSVPAIKDGAEAITTRLAIVVIPRSDAAVVLFGSPAAQGARVQWWEGAMDRATGQLIGEPELKFDGELDRAKFSPSGQWSMTLECGTQAERQLEPNADWRLNQALHGLIWPGELGLAFVTSVARKLLWREAPPNGSFLKRLLKTFVPISNL